MSRAAGRAGGNAPGLLVPALLVLALPAALAPACLFAQSVAAGRVLRPGVADSTPVPGVRVVLHRVGREAQGPVDSTVSLPDGRFRFRFNADTSFIYLLSARHGGVEYFSPPVHVDPARPDTGIALVVHDTSSTAPVAVAARHVVIPRSGEDGTREVLDLIVLENRGLVTRVPPDTVGASWSGPLPPGSEGLEVGDSDVSPDAVERRGDSVFLIAPIGPGQKQLSLQYHLPGDLSRMRIPLNREGGAVNVLLEEPRAAVSGQGLALADTQLFGGRTFRRFTGEVPAGAIIQVVLPSPMSTPVTLLGAMVLAVALGLALAGWRFVGRRPARTDSPPGAPRPDVLLDRIAALDARYGGRQAEVAPPEWAGYQEQRARLKAELETLLAARGPAR